MTTKKRILTAALCILALFVRARRAGAELVLIGITGEVTMAADWCGFLGGTVHEGDIITGTYTYDTSTPDLRPGPAAALHWYYSPPFGISLKIGELEFKTDPDNVEFYIGIEDNAMTAGLSFRDRMYIHSHNNLLTPIGAPPCYRIDLYLASGDGTAISGGDLPSTAPVLSDWSGAGVRIECLGAPCQARQFAIYGVWTDAFVIPEPATLALLGLGALALLRKRSSTQTAR